MRVKPNEYTELENDTLDGTARKYWDEFVGYAKTPIADKPRYSHVGFDVTLFDLVGDHNAAIILHEILFWFTPNAAGNDHKDGGITRDNKWWIARSYEDWWESKRLSKTQVTTALKKLIKLGFIITKTMKSPYHNMNTTKCIHLQRGVFASAWHALPKPEVIKEQAENAPINTSRSDKTSLPDSTNAVVPLYSSNVQNEPTAKTPNSSVSLEGPATETPQASVTENQNTHALHSETNYENMLSELQQPATKTKRPEDKTQTFDNATPKTPPQFRDTPPQTADSSDEIESMYQALLAHTATKAQNRTPDLYSAGRRLLLRGFLPSDIEALEQVIRHRMFSYKKGVPDPLTVDQLIGYIESHDHRPGQTTSPEEQAILKDFDLG